eukprot:TRINITY_DN31186_c0_g1_i1.p1 TRINITY_DN31186_c0_g1~~TRINITY_DN31186_c0_g1_i1.p1  ORF type:complete len:219 (+),score=24.10 TRINITY_DN31186_c0_g1_i1:114-770(+)
MLTECEAVLIQTARLKATAELPEWRSDIVKLFISSKLYSLTKLERFCDELMDGTKFDVVSLVSALKDEPSHINVLEGVLKRKCRKAVDENTRMALAFHGVVSGGGVTALVHRENFLKHLHRRVSHILLDREGLGPGKSATLKLLAVSTAAGLLEELEKPSRKVTEMFERFVGKGKSAGKSTAEMLEGLSDLLSSQSTAATAKRRATEVGGSSKSQRVD